MPLMSAPLHLDDKAGRQLLFICGCPRSGTTATRTLLNTHPQVCIGMERYSSLAAAGKRFEASLFKKERFLSLQPSDTFYSQAEFDSFHTGSRDKFDNAVYVGDKIPTLYKRMNDVFALTPTPVVVFLLRDLRNVAESYNQRARNPRDPYWSKRRDAFAAIRDWNESLRCAAHVLNGHNRQQLIVLKYETFLASTAAMRGLLARLGLPIDCMTECMEEIATHFDRLTKTRNTDRELTDRQKQAISRRADVARYELLLSHAES